jgi:hypothetical protein
MFPDLFLRLPRHVGVDKHTALKHLVHGQVQNVGRCVDASVLLADTNQLQTFADAIWRSFVG